MFLFISHAYICFRIRCVFKKIFCEHGAYKVKQKFLVQEEQPVLEPLAWMTMFGHVPSQ